MDALANSNTSTERYSRPAAGNFRGNGADLEASSGVTHLDSHSGCRHSSFRYPNHPGLRVCDLKSRLGIQRDGLPTPVSPGRNSRRVCVVLTEVLHGSAGTRCVKGGGTRDSAW
jgi:hypothetical protein